MRWRWRIPTFGQAVEELMPRMINRDANDPQQRDWRPNTPEEYCARCGASTGPGGSTSEGCAQCAGHAMPWQRMVRLGAYRPPLDAQIRAMKFHQQWAFGPHLGRQLSQQVADPFKPGRILVTPVPMHWLRRWRRGYNPSALMAKALADARGWPMVCALRRPTSSLPQTRVPASLRARNVRGCFASLGIDLTGYEVVLVDDVKTTGSTLGTCARLLRQAGAKSITAAVAAVADPRHADFKYT